MLKIRFGLSYCKYYVLSEYYLRVYRITNKKEYDALFTANYYEKCKYKMLVKGYLLDFITTPGDNAW